MKHAIIVGSGGQDGTLAAARLAAEGWSVTGIARDGDGAIDLGDFGAVSALVEEVKPDEIYYLAAHHASSERAGGDDEWSLLRDSMHVHVEGLVAFLDAIRRQRLSSRLVYAASSHIFGSEPERSPQDETTPYRPDSPYAISKAAGVEYCRYYAKRHGVFAAAAILYNHESPLRRGDFVSRKIIEGVRRIDAGEARELALGNLSAAVDWGYAPDHVDAMMRIVRHTAPSEFIVATGEAHTVGEFAEAAFALAGLDWRVYVRESGGVQPRSRLVGDATKLRSVTGWRPSVTFEEMIVRLWEG